MFSHNPESFNSNQKEHHCAHLCCCGLFPYAVSTLALNLLVSKTSRLDYICHVGKHYIESLTKRKNRARAISVNIILTPIPCVVPVVCSESYVPGGL